MLLAEREKSEIRVIMETTGVVVVIVGAALMSFMVCKMGRLRAYIRAPRTTDEEDDMRTAFLLAVSSYLEVADEGIIKPEVVLLDRLINFTRKKLVRATDHFIVGHHVIVQALLDDVL